MTAAAAASWHSLPDHVLELIVQNLDTASCSRLSRVCRSMHRLAWIRFTLARRIPALLLVATATENPCADLALGPPVQRAASCLALRMDNAPLPPPPPRTLHSLAQLLAQYCGNGGGMPALELYRSNDTAKLAYALLHTACICAFAYRPDCASAAGPRRIGHAVTRASRLPHFVDASLALAHALHHGSHLLAPPPPPPLHSSDGANARACASRFYSGVEFAAGASPRHIGNDAWLHSIVPCRRSPLLSALWNFCGGTGGSGISSLRLRRTLALPRGICIGIRAASLRVWLPGGGGGAKKPLATVSKTYLDEFHVQWSTDALALTTDVLAATHGTLRCRLLALFIGT